MKEANSIVFDMTNRKTMVGMVVESGDVVLVEDFEPDFRVALAKIDGGIIASAGFETDNITASVPLLVFDHLNQCIPLIEDQELQARLIGSFWTFLVRTATARGLTDPLNRMPGYVLVPHNWPEPVLVSFREACAVNEWIKLRGFPNEAASFVIGTLQYTMFMHSAHFSTSTSIAACVIACISDFVVEVCYFQYSVVDPVRHRIFIRDFFRTSISDLAGDLRSRDWFGSVMRIVSLESSKLSERSNTILTGAFERLPLRAFRSECSSKDLLALKMKGAAYIARCCEGRSTESIVYNIETACCIGLQTSESSFHPMLTQIQTAAADRYPVTSCQAFVLSAGRVGEVRVNARCGYSSRVEESTLLGSLTFSRHEIQDALSNRQHGLTAVIRLDSPSRGELRLELGSTGVVIRRHGFAIPGLMN